MLETYISCVIDLLDNYQILIRDSWRLLEACYTLVRSRLWQGDTMGKDCGRGICWVKTVVGAGG